MYPCIPRGSRGGGVALLALLGQAIPLSAGVGLSTRSQPRGYPLIPTMHVVNVAECTSGPVLQAVASLAVGGWSFGGVSCPPPRTSRGWSCGAARERALWRQLDTEVRTTIPSRADFRSD